MQLNYTVQAQVIDIRSDTPTKEDIFLVDSNVWYWYACINATRSFARPYQITQYPSYINQAKIAQSLLSYSGFSLAELARNIEQQERKIFSYILTAKEYRHNFPAERANLFAQIQNVWNQVTSIGICTDILINKALTNTVLNRFETQLLDGYDLLILEAMEKAGIKQIITDEGDYVTVPGIKVFTANFNAIAAARSQGKLLVR